MSHHTQEFQRIPSHLLLTRSEIEDDSSGVIRLPVRGQGTVGFTLSELKPFSLHLKSSEAWGGNSYRWDIRLDEVELMMSFAGNWTSMFHEKGEGIGLDLEPKCSYWFSIDFINRKLTYGKGEMRVGTALAQHNVPLPQPNEDDPYAWIEDVDHVEVSPNIFDVVDIWRDPVSIEVPLRVFDPNSITMDDIATNKATVPANLTLECQQLYQNVAGDNFTLDTPEFPQFTAAIEESIRNPRGWCYKMLQEKSTEFGEDNPNETYLRITMGANQGESPGIPFVLEIWPPGHYSPIHEHAGANAIIRVLHGSIHVDLFPMLSKYHEKPFASADFNKGEVTWITPRLNQVHQLTNTQQDGPTCITIQCYLYPENNLTHYPYFDYIENNKIGHFVPNSDMGFMEFKETMKKEWEEWCK